MTTDNQAVKPLLAVKYPFVTEDGKEFSDLDKLLTELGQQSGGYYLLGANNWALFHLRVGEYFHAAK